MKQISNEYCLRYLQPYFTPPVFVTFLLLGHITFVYRFNLLKNTKITNSKKKKKKNYPQHPKKLQKKKKKKIMPDMPKSFSKKNT